MKTDRPYENFKKSYIGLRRDLLKYVKGKDNNVLDVGCATGINGYYLKKNLIASNVVGIEKDVDMAKDAKRKLDQVIIHDLNTLDIPLVVGKNKFNYIILGDILEHLIDPWNILRNLSETQLENGKMILSIPNIRHIETIIQIYLKKKWPYNERGIFDKSHLRFFTFLNVIDLLNDAGLKIVQVERKFRFRDKIGSKFPPFIGSVLKKVTPDLFTFQYIIVACKERGDH